MARPLSPSDATRNGNKQNHEDAARDLDAAPQHGGRNGFGVKPPPEIGPDELAELEHLRGENEQLRTLCVELEQALQEATQPGGGEGGDERQREYEALLEEKSETIRQLHQQLEDAQTMVAELEQGPRPAAAPGGPVPREDELLSLSEELERERRQLQEDEQSLMEQMREMEVSMARERAEMARQRNDMQRLHSEIRHELERLERSGVVQSKLDSLKSKLQDASTRRGMAQSHGAAPASSPPQPTAQPTPTRKNDSLIGRLFGGGK
jgi:hypothetical protein